MIYKKAIIILGGGLVKDKQTDRWRTTNYDEGDNFGVQGDRLRVIAADYLFKDNPEQVIIALGGKGQLKDIPDAPTVSEVIEKELLELEVPGEKIIKEEESGNSWQQLMGMKKLINELGLEDCKIISNKFHLPRLKAMAELDSDLKKIMDSSNIDFKSAEEILLKYNPEEWQNEIESVYKSEAMKERIKMEEKGIKDIKDGKYKLK